MGATFHPVARQNLADDLAQRINDLIQRREYEAGDRLPAITAMATQFGVGAPTLREALRKLEAVGVVDIRHGSGVYVAAEHGSMLLTNPVFAAPASKKLLVDLIEARIPIEIQSATHAARNATEQQIAEMQRLLDRASANLDDAAVLNETNLAFHREIANASGNTVIAQLLEVLSNLFREEQRLIIDIHGSRRDDHAEHAAICDALGRRREKLAGERMKAHLEGVRDVLLHWDPKKNPVTRAVASNGARRGRTPGFPSRKARGRAQ
jgi:GntR family transcriptional regulator, transcriptional repressor for pyruvate dehydrogenase complex